jgi:hypothetical protein
LASVNTFAECSVAVTNEDFSHGLDALFGNLSSLTAHCGKGNMGFVPISSSQNEWNNNHIGVPSFILSGAPVFDYSGTKLGATEVPAALRFLSAVRPTRIELVKPTKRDLATGKASVISGVPPCPVFLRSSNRVPLDCLV